MSFSTNSPTAAFVLCIVTVPICVLAAVLRLLATRATSRKHSNEDWCAYAAVVFHLVYAGIALHAIIFLGGRDIVMIPFNDLLYSAAYKCQPLGQVYYALPIPFGINQLLTKASLLFFYHRIFGIHRGFARWIYVLGVANVGWFITMVALSLFSCRPVSKGWDLFIPGTCFDYDSSTAITETLNALLDFAIAILGALMVRTLRVSRATKWKLSILLAIGGLAGIVAFVMIAQIYTFTGVINYMPALWAIVQSTCSVICCCAPIYKSILPKKGLFKRLKSFAFPTGSGSTEKINSSSHSWPRADQFATLEKNSVSVSFSPSESMEPIQNFSWLQLDDANQTIKRAAVWAEASSGTEPERKREPVYELNAISVQKTVEVV
ncbi:hypothetical protein C8A03DRAFT_19227 [Achaetomium macrosporum]|uniref:Rhodopsin domain-containing protein n=1 Tax=Achaetomium macrosporum TaxID=79813 RepID=A0AAN7HAF0_9PEZI|nr:hypothetical protein C8A03DRAFT_19227 [Achaetomium macrosporum]